MYTLRFNSKRCVDCGNCESILGNLHKRVLFNKLIICDEEYIGIKDLIDKTISKCFLDAITLMHEEEGPDEYH